jgi:predicted dehydrogenase
MLKFVLFGFKFGKFVHYPIIKKNFELIKIISKQEKREKKEVSEIIRKADAITIATPPLEQKNIFNEAFVQKKHIFFEKPLGFMPKKKD